MILAAIMMKPRFTRDPPRELVRALTEAIDRIVPGQGSEVYWRAFERWEAALRHSSRQLALPLSGGQAPGHALKGLSAADIILICTVKPASAASLSR